MVSAGVAANRDTADLLYRYGIGSVLVSLLASSGLAFVSAGQIASRFLFCWWTLITTVLILRGLDILLYRFRPAASQRAIREIRRFSSGVVLTAILWAAFPLAFLEQLNQNGRAYTAIVLCGMAGGGATVLAPSKNLSLVFCTLLVLPTSIRFLFLTGSANTFLGILGCAFFLVMFASSRVSHRATMTAVQLSHTNEALVVEMKEANLELRAAREALSESNRSLELRIKARTADLEMEMREKEHYAKELAYLASTDSLTGLCNRGTFSERLRKLLLQSESASQPLAVLFVDLDKFKEVNDVMGHPAGDSVLQTIAGRLMQRLPAPAELARWGGDEFVVAFPCKDGAEAAVSLATNLNESCKDSIDIEGRVVRIAATVGIAFFPEHGRTPQELIHAADLAMYASKEEKHSKIKVFEPSLSQRLIDRRLFERTLRDAVGTRAMSVVFQPIVTASDGSCETVEALMRWDHPERGPIPAVEFIPLAERIGEIGAIGRWVLIKACQEASSWTGPRPPSVSVNVSAIQMELGTLLVDLSFALKAAGLPATRLQLELTESVFAGDHRKIIPTLLKLRQIGIKISLDDFGTGFSCLADLQRLPIDQLKIDKSFIDSLDTDSNPIVIMILAVAQSFGLKVVAEGVETEEQAKRLISLGAHYLQGYLFSKPLSPNAVREWLLAHHGARNPERRRSSM